MNEYTLEEVIENNFIIIDDKVYDFKEFDEWMNDLIKKNGTTEY